MSDDKQQGNKEQAEHELTFESGYGAQDKVLKNDETLEEVAGVSEEAIRKDVQKVKDKGDNSNANKSNKD